MPLTTTTQNPGAIEKFYDRTLLKRALAPLLHDKFGQTRPVPKGNSRTIKFRRYPSLAAATTPLTEGTPPASVQVSPVDIEVTATQYGNFIEYSDVVSYDNIDPIVTEYTELMGENMGLTLDSIYRDGLIGGTSVYYGGSLANAAINTRVEVVSGVNADELAVLYRTLKSANAKPFTEIMAGASGENTFPISASYYAIVSPFVAHDLRNLDGFIETHRYANPKAAMENEIGSFKGIRFVETSNARVFTNAGGLVTSTGLASTGGTNIDIHPILVFGKDAYGKTPLKEACKTIVKPLGYADALDQVGTVGWKAISAVAILNELAMVRYEVGASA